MKTNEKIKILSIIQILIVNYEIIIVFMHYLQVIMQSFYRLDQGILFYAKVKIETDILIFFIVLCSRLIFCDLLSSIIIK